MVLISEHLPALIRSKLEQSGNLTIPLPADPRLAPPIASHPDMLVYIDRGILITDRTYYREIACKQIDNICAAGSLTLQLTDEPPRPEYPHDIRFNAARIGRFLLCYPRYTSPAILRLADWEKLTVLPSRQGYARCSVCPVGEHALITADPSITRAVQQQKDLDILVVHQGHVVLPGYPHGFIGGCCGIFQNQLFFCGDPALHPDGKAILQFIRNHGISPVILSQEPLFDGGSLLFVSPHTNG